MEWNLALMSSRQFQNYYGINLNTNDGRWEAALAVAQRPTASEFSIYIAPALGAKGIVFDNEAWLTVTIKPAVYAGGLEAENQIAMGLYGAINISLGILKKDYLGAFSMRNNLTNGSGPHRLDDPGAGFVMSMVETSFIAGANDLGLLKAFDKGYMSSYRASSRVLNTYTRGAVTTLRAGTKVLGTAGLVVGAGLATYNISTGNGQLSDVSDILVIGGSAVVLGVAGVAAAPFVAAGGLIYGGFMLFGGSDLINNSDLGKSTSSFLKF
jgi:hypothetical protein